jgi:hypothetical protein
MPLRRQRKYNFPAGFRKFRKNACNIDGNLDMALKALSRTLTCHIQTKTSKGFISQ